MDNYYYYIFLSVSWIQYSLEYKEDIDESFYTLLYQLMYNAVLSVFNFIMFCNSGVELAVFYSILHLTMTENLHTI